MGDSYTARIERLSSGAPGLILIMEHLDEFGDKKNEMSVVIENGTDFLEPVVDWLISSGY